MKRPLFLLFNNHGIEGAYPTNEEPSNNEPLYTDKGNKTTPKLEEKPTFDPNEDPYNPLFNPPKWFWPSIGGWGVDQLYKNWPHRDTPKKDKKTPEKPAYNQER